MWVDIYDALLVIKTPSLLPLKKKSESSEFVQQDMYMYVYVLSNVRNLNIFICEIQIVFSSFLD